MVKAWSGEDIIDGGAGIGSDKSRLRLALRLRQQQWELRNTARRYLGTCSADSYGRKFFGLQSASPEEKRARACREIWEMSRGIAQASGKEAQLDILCRAFDDERLLYDAQ